MRWIVLLCALLFSTVASAQCTGVAPANSLCGNLTGSPNVPGFYPATGAITGTVSQNWVPQGAASNVLGNGFYLLPNPSNMYASPTGSDTNNTCTNSGTPCTLKGACIIRSALASFLQSQSGGITINLANGTYSAVDLSNNLCTINGNAGGSAGMLTFITGNVGSPSSVVLSVPAGNTGIAVSDLGETEINGITITGGNNSVGVGGRQFAVIDGLGITWGAWGTGGVHYNISTGTSLNIFGDTITANIATHIGLGTAHLSVASGAINIPSPVAWGTAFISVLGNSSLAFNASAITGAGVAGTTGVQALLEGNGFLSDGGTPCATFFPGNGGCSIIYGFQDDASDKQTAGGALNSFMPTPTRAGDIVYNNGSSWWQTLAGNNSGTQCLAENSSGAPSWVQCSPTYTAGTWTPIIITDGTVGTPAYTTQLGTYEQIGRQITARFNIQLSGWTGSPTGNVGISGLPVADVGNYGTCTVSFYSAVNLANAASGISGIIPDTSSTISLYSMQNTSTIKLTAAAMTTVGGVVGWCSYHN